MTDVAPVIEGRTSTGVWGAAAGAGVLVILVAYFCYAHLYLAVSNDDWPPAGTAPLPLLAPAGLTVLVAVVAALAVRAGRPLAPGGAQVSRAATLGLVALLGAVAVVAGGLLVDGLDLSGSQHAHDASVLTLHALVGFAAVTGVLISALAAFEAGRLGDHPWVAAAAAVSGVWWATVAVSWVAVAAVVYGWPQLS